MVNIKNTIKGTILTLEIDVSKAALANGRVSASGKSKVFATTSGNQNVTLPDGTVITIGINAYTKV